MAEVLVNGKWVNVDDLGDGYVNTGDVRRAAGIPPDRALVRMEQGGANEALSDSTNFQNKPNFMIMDTALGIRG